MAIPNTMSFSGKTLSILTASLLLAGCASNGDSRDPWEPTNRAIYSFNETLDKVALKPLAQGYEAITPSPVRDSVRNFYSNLDDVTVFANSLLQFKLEQAASDLLRVAFNTTFGLFGVWDVATEMGLKKHNEDFGQTLGRWGIDSGPYLVLPVFGPSSFRDGVGLVVDSYNTDLVYQNEHIPSRNQTAFLRLVSRRADLQDAKSAIDEAALDGYEFTRDFYLDRREALVQDGRPRPLE
jgi:phospholipid-binding lipoprotein MlaA